MNTYTRILICLAAIAVLAAPSCATPTPFVISGWIFNEDGTACDDPVVNITNTDTDVEWQAVTAANYYQIIYTNGTDLNESEQLQFSAKSPDGSQSNVVDRTVAQAEVDAGGIFGFNITFASSDTTPPASVTDLQNTTYEQTYINWTWTDPEDADFAKVMVYIDGTPQPDVLKGVQYYHATGLNPDTEYEIGTRTVDNLGNINDTWENCTARTKPGAVSEMCLGTCCNDSECNESYATDMTCAECIALGKHWHPNKDTACFNDTPFDLCLDWCPACCDCLDNDGDTNIDYPADGECSCGLDPSETTSLPPIPELATFALIGIGLMLVVGLTRFGRRKR